MFKKVLIANRGEIAVRIIRTCRELGIQTVAVYSEPDATAVHVLEADEAVSLGEPEPAKSYLNMDRILSAAHSKGADAIHPGYGFLAENPEFAQACEASKITFVGPPARVMRELGNKPLSRQMMHSAGLRVIPGMLEATTDPALLTREADRIGYPLLVKAAAGGGGKGMRRVPDRDALQEAIHSARGEAEKAFGDGSLYLEKDLEAPRHVEFQILADQQGHAVHLFERECSIQRRHQKIVEETPSPVMTPSLREAMGEAALLAARASGYVNAGTVEFLLDRSGQFYFLEVNTRLQVEHPITEMTTGVDMVRHQLEIAAGRALTITQDALIQRGHAIECRIYAEDPEAHFCPSPGPIIFCREPSGPGIRVDSGIDTGLQVPVDYDPILSKVIVVAEEREAARRRMIRALENYAVIGIRTTIPFLLDLLRSRAFMEGDTQTDFIDRHLENWRHDTKGLELAAIAFVVDDLIPRGRVPYRGPKSGGWPSPWERLGDWKI